MDALEILVSVEIDTEYCKKKQAHSKYKIWY